MKRIEVEAMVKINCPNDYGEIMNAVEKYSKSQRVVTEAMMKKALLVGGTPAHLASLLTRDLQSQIELSPDRLLKAV